MLFILFTTLFINIECVHNAEPKFQVLTPNELMVEVPRYEDKKLVTFRIGIKRPTNPEEDLELGENDISNDRIFIYDPRINLKKGDLINYLIAYKDDEGYKAHTGQYYFNGVSFPVYYKKPFANHKRYRRTLGKSNRDSDENEDFDPAEPRFGYHGHGGPWRRHGYGFGGPHGGFHPPKFGEDCNDSGEFVEFHCRKCREGSTERPEVTSTSTGASSGTDASQNIDIRFSD